LGLPVHGRSSLGAKDPLKNNLSAQAPHCTTMAALLIGHCPPVRVEITVLRLVAA